MPDRPIFVRGETPYWQYPCGCEADVREIRHCSNHTKPRRPGETLSCGCYLFETGGAQFCRLHRNAQNLLDACKATAKACDELMTELVSKTRAANWGIINEALVQAGQAIKSATQT